MTRVRGLPQLDGDGGDGLCLFGADARRAGMVSGSATSSRVEGPVEARRTRSDGVPSD